MSDKVNIGFPTEKLPYSQICGTKLGTSYKKRRQSDLRAKHPALIDRYWQFLLAEDLNAEMEFIWNPESLPAGPQPCYLLPGVSGEPELLPGVIKNTENVTPGRPDRFFTLRPIIVRLRRSISRNEFKYIPSNRKEGIF